MSEHGIGKLTQGVRTLASRIRGGETRGGLPQAYTDAVDLVVPKGDASDVDILSGSLDTKIRKALIYHAATQFRGASPHSIGRTIDSRMWRMYARGKVAVHMIASHVVGPIVAMGGLTTLATQFEQSARFLEPLKQLLNPLGVSAAESAKVLGSTLGAAAVPLTMLSIFGGRIMSRFSRRDLEASNIIRKILNDPHAMAELRQVVIQGESIMQKADQLIGERRTAVWKKMLASISLASVGVVAGLVASGALLPTGSLIELAKLMKDTLPYVDSGKVVESFGTGAEFMSRQVKNAWGLINR